MVAGYPSGDKRLTFVQMEALTGLSARDEWDFEYLGQTNQPFIKANYVSDSTFITKENVQLVVYLIATLNFLDHQELTNVLKATP